MKQKPKFVTKLFAVIDGYVETKAQSEQHALTISRSARDTIKPLIEHHNGVWMYEKNGEIFANFKLPEDAVNCAVAIQREMSGTPDVNLRIGIHTGDIKSGIGTGDIVASGIAKMAATGGVCVSDKVYSAIQKKVDCKAEYIDDKNIEGIERPVRVYALIGEGLSEQVSADSHDSQKHKQSTKPSIVVLPFINMSPDPEQEYFSDGLTEEIITDLSQIHDLLVISRSSAMTFKGTKKKIKEIAKEVNVQHVLEGSVRKAGNNLRITAQLIDATNDSHLWAEKYSGTLDDVFDIQEKVSRSIVDALKLKLSPEEHQKMIEHPIPDVKAYECYLKARQDIILVSEEALPRALENLQKALDIVGENATLYFGMGYVYFMYENIGTKSSELYLKKAEEYVSRVFELEPESSHGYLLQGLIQYKRGKLQEVVSYLKKALAIEPDDCDVLFWLALAYCEVGKPSAAVPLVNRLLQLDPFIPIYQVMHGYIHLMEGRFEMALEPGLRGFKMEPGNSGVRFYYALVLAINKRISEACSLIDVMVREVPNETFSLLGAMCKYALQGDKTNTLLSLTEELINVAKRDEQLPWIIAGCLTLIDEKEEALNWLEHAVNRGFINYPYLNKYDPFLENIRGEERFKKLMERVKYEWENFEV